MRPKEEKKTRVRKPKIDSEKPLSESEFFDALTEALKKKGKTIETTK